MKNFYLDDPYLFKNYPDQIFQKCIPDNEVSSVIKLCHSEACGSHFSLRKTTAKIIQNGFYWPTMFKDTHAFCKACENCQKSGFISKHKESLDNLLLTLETYPGAVQTKTLLCNWIISGALDLRFRSTLYGWKAKT